MSLKASCCDAMSPFAGIVDVEALILPLAGSTDFARRGKSAIPCPAPFVKIFLFESDPNQMRMSRHPVPLEGRIAIVTDVGAGCGGRGRRFDEDAGADGEVVWS
jgi:hypothetical protein